MSEAGHVVIAGAGVAGCATAYYLSAAGVRVTLVEREGPGGQASGWSAGGLNPLHGVAEPVRPWPWSRSGCTSRSGRRWSA